MAEAMSQSMTALLAYGESALPPGAADPWDDDGTPGAVGNVMYADPGGRYHVMAVVFPEGTSSGIHHHGCWGVIGYLVGGDEETRYDDQRDEASRHVWHRGDVTFLLPDEGEGWHRVRNPGPGVGITVHILCRLPHDHPHRLWDRVGGRILPYPFVEVAPGRWRASPGEAPEMGADEALRILDALGAAEAAVWVDGGWGVDALVGHQTRPHDDLDLVVRVLDLDTVEAALVPLGYRVTMRVGLTRWVLGDDAGRAIDLHPLTFDDSGTGWQAAANPDGSDCPYPPDGFTTGSIDGQTVRCLTAALQIRHHEGYDKDGKDHHDLGLLAIVESAPGS